MDLEEIAKTKTWIMYEQGNDYLRANNVFTDTDKNYRFYNGNQWEGAKIEGIENAQYNFIETVVNYKTSTINQNLWAINFSSENFETKEFRKTAEQVCKMLNRKAAKVWEKDQMDHKIRGVSDDAAINDEGIIYVDYDTETQDPVNEIINKNNIQFANEQSSDIQSQPFVIISQRLPVSTVKELAKKLGIAAEKINLIAGDNISFEEAGEEAKLEKDEMCTVVTKMWKKDGSVHYSKATKYTDLIEDEDTGLSLYPVAHFIWKEKKGWSRGEGEVRTLIPNQLEVNKTLARQLLSVKNCAYPQKVALIEKILNPEAIGSVGGLIKVHGQTIDDINKVYGYVQPTQMSTDVSRLIDDLIIKTRDLKNSGDIATGGINPEQASGKAILAVQQASQQPLVKQLTGLKRFIEDLARIWLDMWTVYTPDGMTLEQEAQNPETGEEEVALVQIPASVLENLQGTVKVDITPKGAFDRYARELTLENCLKEGLFAPQRVNELKAYAEALPDDAAAPKQEILDTCDKIIADQERIAQINAEAQMMQQRYDEFIGGSPEDQADTINQAMETSAA